MSKLKKILLVLAFCTVPILMGLTAGRVVTTAIFFQDFNTFIRSDTASEIEFGVRAGEDVSFNFGTSNTVALTSDSGVTVWDFGALSPSSLATLTGDNGQVIDFQTNNRVELQENSETFGWIFGTNKIEYLTDSGVTTIDFNDVDILEDIQEINGDNSQKIDFVTNNRIEVSDNSETFGWIFGTNKIELLTDSGITVFDFNDVDALEDIESIDTGTDAFLLFTSNSLTTKYKVFPVGAGITSASEVIVGNGGQGELCVGLAAGAAEIGTTEGFAQSDTDTDFLRFWIPLPDDWIDTGTQADLVIQFDIKEDAGEECNLDVRIFEKGNTTQILSDTLLIANGQSRQWESLITNSTGIGNDSDIDGDDSGFLIEITGTATADDFSLYAVRWKYRVGMQATQ